MMIEPPYFVVPRSVMKRFRKSLNPETAVLAASGVPGSCIRDWSASLGLRSFRFRVSGLGLRALAVV